MIALDFLVTLLRRWRGRQPLFLGDRSHLYDQLTDRGWSIRRILVLGIAFHAGLVGIGLGVAYLPWLGALLAAVLVGSMALLGVWRLGFVNPHLRR